MQTRVLIAQMILLCAHVVIIQIYNHRSNKWFKSASKIVKDMNQLTNEAKEVEKMMHDEIDRYIEENKKQ